MRLVWEKGLKSAKIVVVECSQSSECRGACVKGIPSFRYNFQRGQFLIKTRHYLKMMFWATVSVFRWCETARKHILPQIITYSWNVWQSIRVDREPKNDRSYTSISLKIFLNIHFCYVGVDTSQLFVCEMVMGHNYIINMQYLRS